MERKKSDEEAKKKQRIGIGIQIAFQNSDILLLSNPTTAECCGARSL
jgi:hypothetical protein